MDNIQAIKSFISKDILKSISNSTTQNILREILFNDRNSIDWKDAERIIFNEMPELVREFPNRTIE